MILFVKLAAGLAALYVVVIVLIALAQDWLLFPRWAMGNGTALLPAPAEQLTLELPSGERLLAYRYCCDADLLNKRFSLSSDRLAMS